MKNDAPQMLEAARHPRPEPMPTAAFIRSHAQFTATFALTMADCWLRYTALVDAELQPLLAAKQHQHKPALRFTHAIAWQWFLANHPEKIGTYNSKGVRSGQSAADEYLKNLWEKAHPPRPRARPSGLVTAKQLLAVAHGRVLEKLLAAYTSQTTR